MKNALARYKLRKIRIRKKVFGTSARPRLRVYRSLKQVYAQVIDDVTGRVLAADSTISKLNGKVTNGGSIAAANVIGERIAKKAISAGITKVVFDRGGWPYHGRIKALAESARKAGLEF
ncbi:MAG: 50S ribosomal protein L18 [bacterium]